VVLKLRGNLEELNKADRVRGTGAVGGLIGPEGMSGSVVVLGDWLDPAGVLDHVVVLGERHLGHLLAFYTTYYPEARAHLSLDKDAPIPREVQGLGRIFAKPYMRKAKSRG